MPVIGADQLVHLTTRIETTGPGGRGSGTGFFITFETTPGMEFPVLVTNKHVIAGARTGRINFNRQGPDGEPMKESFVPITLDDFEKRWILHPDPDVDLAALPVGQFANELKDSGRMPFFRSIPTSVIARQADLEKLTAMESIVMVGYPNGIWDAKNNRPIIRRGITATPPYDHFEGRPQFVIDCACFPGSSGSPVLIWDHMHTDKAGNTKIGTRVLLLGVLYAGPQMTAEGEVITCAVPTANDKQFARTQMMINLGYCVRAEQLLWFEGIIRTMLAKSIKAATA